MIREEDVDAPENTLQLPPGPPQKRQKRERERGRSRWQRRVETAEEGCGGAWGGSLGAGRGGRRGAAGRTPGESRGSGHLTSRSNSVPGSPHKPPTERPNCFLRRGVAPPRR